LHLDTLQSRLGCDSVITVVDLKVRTVLITNLSESICSGQTFKLPSGQIVSASGVYNDTLTSSLGCDSVVIVKLVVKPTTKTTVSASICAGESYRLPGGRIVQGQGVYTDILQSVNGCDSIITTTLKVNPRFTKTENAVVCAGQSYRLPGGRTVNTTGVYTDILKASSGCDSTIITNLYVTALKRSTLSMKVCEGQSYTLPSGKIVRNTGIYNDTVRTRNGCDSIVTRLELVVLKSITENKSVVICQGERYTLPSGRIVETSGMYRDIVQYAGGCDSLTTIVQITYKPTPPRGVTGTPGVCEGDSTVLTAYGGDRYKWLNISGTGSPDQSSIRVSPRSTTTYKVVITTPVCGFNDTISTTVAVHPKPVINLNKTNDIECQTGVVRLSASGGSSYKWWPASSLDQPNTATPVASPDKSTMYHVEVISDKGCVSRDSIEVKVIPGQLTDGYKLPNAFTPNNDGKNDCFGATHWGNVTNFDLRIFNRWGQMVFQTNDPKKCWDGSYNSVQLETGGYVFKVTATTICGPIKREGMLMLIR
jgi:gliding motility-associated-like protein